ncbi:MBL fold metallo-hydrolase [Phenylobacterium sp.]|jgi:glyoxylase-like metal-dependent hydrolase (beta-lactamase superfamily II)|uniref:MBL fold metallo-hydrolase n=1 Tax=Phenylobacterium sp. TaxID=1871053 RepID=UPI002E3564B9|nr:MBL fold metallo-hydrolase [Phenylobacterium sp.]HEX2560850.1 MBL fold metallo-hydrolase [Phenylobacterium sp.]
MDEHRIITWRVGDVRITKVLEHESAFPPQFLLPAADPAELDKIGWLKPHFLTSKGLMRLSVHALVVETPTLKILVDTCVGNDKQGRQVADWNERTTPFLGFLAEAGYAPDDIDVVLCTHLHADHVGWNTTLVDGAWQVTFKRARHLIHRVEYDYWSSQTDAETKAMLADSLQPVIEADLAELVELPLQLCEEVALVPSPGHTPGHCSVAIASRGERAMITGDFMHHPCQIARPHWNAVSDRDPDQAERTRREQLGACAAGGVLVIGTHFPGPTAGRVSPEGGAWRFDV